jgi:hypothetical protein
MELEKIFVLTNKRTYRHSLNIYPFDSMGKMEKRNIIFTTEHLVDKSQRTDMAQKVAAQYFAKNDAEVKALLSNSGYGETFVRIDDPKGELKLPTTFVSAEDAEKAALKLNFDSVGLPFNPGYDLKVLKHQYEQHIHALAGVNKVLEGSAKEIPVKPVDFAKERAEAIQLAKAKFEEKYGYPVPEIVANDTAFLDGLSNPEFDAESYIAKKEETAEDVERLIDANENKAETIEELQKKYFDKFGKNVANIKKNDAAWIKGELAKE